MNENKNGLQEIQHQGYQVVQTPDGKFKRTAVYNQFSSVIPETREQKINMMNLLDGDGALAMNDHIGAKIEIADVILNPYDSVDEETGEVTYGVLSYLIDTDGNAFVTSSKSVYFTLRKIFTVFGEPHYGEGETITVEIVKKQGQSFKYTDIKVVG